MERENVKKIQEKVLQWYEKNGRHNLPWRHTEDVYHIFISEVMLQQTNVPKVIAKYLEFITLFPTLNDLAQAQQRTVIAIWQGLGYNRRAIYVHRAVREIVDRFDGIFPETYDDLCSLPGIGPYTAHAILIFARNHNIVTHDVNIVRVMCRLRKKGSAKERQIIKWTTTLLPQDRSRDWHNALMDFASLICTKKKPQCDICPLRVDCRSFPCPIDQITKKRKEIGRVECGKHIPRRIYRGRIIEYLRNQTGSSRDIGIAIKKDWNKKNDIDWCEDILHILEREKLIVCKKGKWMLQ